jgi:hypothetical protein
METKTSQEIFDELVALRKEQETVFWKEAELLYWLLRRGKWKDLIAGAESKREIHYLIDIPESSANFKVGLYRAFRVRYNIPVDILSKLSTNKLAKIIPTLEGVTRKELLKKLKKL